MRFAPALACPDGSQKHKHTGTGRDMPLSPTSQWCVCSRAWPCIWHYKPCSCLKQPVLHNLYRHSASLKPTSQRRAAEELALAVGKVLVGARAHKPPERMEPGVRPGHRRLHACEHHPCIHPLMHEMRAIEHLGSLLRMCGFCLPCSCHTNALRGQKSCMHRSHSL